MSKLSLTDLLILLDERDIRVCVEGGRLRFNAPKGAMTADFTEALKACKADLLAHLDRNRRRPLRPASREEPMPLSYEEERLCILNRLYGPSGTYNVSFYEWVPLPINLRVLRDAMRFLQQRHESLRTTYKQVNGQPTRHIAPVPTADPLGIDLTVLDSAMAWKEMQRVATEEAARPFDLEAGPLWRIALLRLSHNGHVLLVTIHHIVFDGWSKQVMLRELIQAYWHAHGLSRFCPPPLRIQYADLG